MTNTEQESADSASSDIQTHAADIALALRSLKPNAQHRKSQLFSLVYPVISELLNKNVTQKAILEKLDELGLKLHPSRFKELMAAHLKMNAVETSLLENA